MALPSTGYDSQSATNPGSALTDFTLLVDLSTMSADWWSAVDTADGTKGRASKGDETELACDWISFDDGAETGFLRVKWSGTLAASGTQTVRVYPPVSGNASVAAGDTYGSDNAYDGSSEMYASYDADASDRTSNGRDGSATGTPGDTTGQVGGAQSFGGSDYYTVSGIPAIVAVASDWTVSFWYKLPASYGAIESLFGSAQSSTDRAAVSVETNGDLRAGTYNGSWDANSGTTNDTAWHFLVIRNTSGSFSLRIDTADQAGTASGSSSSTNAATFGARNDGAIPFTGDLDDVRVDSSSRSNDWADEEFAQANDNATFWGSWSWTATGIVVLRRRRECA